MTPLVFLTIALAGGAGAAFRMLLDTFITGRIKSDLPWATIVINLSGSFALGLIGGLVAASILPGPWLQIAGTGFLGGYTTFSTTSYQTVQLLQKGDVLKSGINAVGTLFAATALAGLGLWIGAML